MENSKNQIALLAVAALKAEYPDAICSLVYPDAFRLLVATRLAAQCTDKRVNMVTPALFARFGTPQTCATATIEEMESLIKTCGLYKTKARDIINIAKMLNERYNSIVPDTIEELTKLPGVGRKTANLILGDIFKKPSVVVDTHCIRLTRRLGLHSLSDATKIEFALKELLPPEESNDFCHRLVLHGRAVCKAQKPVCDRCCMKIFCKKVI
jgi:endonuclease-3